MIKSMQNIDYSNLGRISLPEDIRDKRLDVSTAGPIAPTYSGSNFFSLVPLMQGLEPACGGFSKAAWDRDHNLGFTSPRFNYMGQKSKDGVPTVAGTTIRGMGSAAIHVGVCNDSLVSDDITLPYQAYGDISFASPQAIAQGLSDHQGTYLFIDVSSMQSIKQAMQLNNGVILEVEVGKEWYTAPSGVESWNEADILPLRTPRQIISGHFIYCNAYDENCIYFINSWSNEWGRNGFGYFSSDYIPFVTHGIVFNTLV
jgi:hypothetical protein